MQEPDFLEIVELIVKEDGRYSKPSYGFVRQGLDHTLKEIKKKDPSRPQRSPHVNGSELVEGLRSFALEQYGPLAKTVLNSWGIRECRDFGEIVFNLIEYNVFSKTDNDRLDDFSGVYDFDVAFVKPFEPTKRRVAATRPVEST
ncbi:MAG TPA: Minf_1886 family protein [Opitutaceae bacterium]|nr:Minf_1886 family protein [Opitutaceae bacterium]